LVGLLCGVLLLWGLDRVGRMPRFGRPTQSEALRASRRNAIVEAVDRTRRSVVTIRVEGRRRITRPQDELLWLPFAPGRYGSFQWGGQRLLHRRRRFRAHQRARRPRRPPHHRQHRDPTHGMSVQADLVGVAPQFDLALLRVPPPVPNPAGGLADAGPQFAPAKIGDSDDVMVGEWAIAIGSPFGYELGSLDPSVSVGVISAVQRDVPPQSPGRRRGRISRCSKPMPRSIKATAAARSSTPTASHRRQHGELRDAGRRRQRHSLRDPDQHRALGVAELLTYGEVRKPWIGWSVAEVPPDVRPAAAAGRRRRSHRHRSRARQPRRSRRHSAR
jgi:hypothetical protein